MPVNASGMLNHCRMRTVLCPAGWLLRLLHMPAARPQLAVSRHRCSTSDIQATICWFARQIPTLSSVLGSSGAKGMSAVTPSHICSAVPLEPHTPALRFAAHCCRTPLLAVLAAEEHLHRQPGRLFERQPRRGRQPLSSAHPLPPVLTKQINASCRLRSLTAAPCRCPPGGLALVSALLRANQRPQRLPPPLL